MATMPPPASSESIDNDLASTPGGHGSHHNATATAMVHAAPTAASIPPPVLDVFRLLDLAPEVRRMFYDCFASVPAHSESTEEERAAIIETRNALRVVSKFISAEWSPIFFRTTNIIVHGPKFTDPGSRQLVSNGVAKQFDLYASRTLAFERQFLRMVSPSVMSNIRTIHYDGTYSHQACRLLGYGRIWAPIDFADFRRFVRMLDNCREMLPLLQKVKLKGQWRFYPDLWSRWPGNQMPDAQAVWERADQARQWEQIEIMLVHQALGAALRGWDIHRHVTFEWTTDDQKQTYSVQKPCGRIRSVEVVFSKKPAGQFPPSQPQLAVDYSIS